ncbi:hypothetical protein HK405_013344 [Cladochytrium tenue]|nr:hypothetical protein HK405_013344 [Cladochytrium tenue]
MLHNDVPERLALVSKRKVANFRFDLAQREASASLSSFFASSSEAKDLEKGKRISFSWAPDVAGSADYWPGFLITATEDTVRNCLAMCDDSSLAVVRIQSGPWFVHEHFGGYDGLKNAWSLAMKEMAENGLKMDCDDGTPFELYLNSEKMGVVPDSELVTEIWLPVGNP